MNRWFRGVALAAVACLWPGAGAGAQDARLRVVIPHTNAVKAATFSPDGRTILTGGHQNSLRLFDAASGNELRTFTGGPQRTVAMNGDEGFVFAVAYAPDGLSAVSGHGDGTVRLWDVASGVMLRFFRGHRETAKAVAFSPDGRSILSGGQDATMRHVEIETGKVYAVYKARIAVDRVAFAPHGRVGVSSGFGDVRVWNLVNAQQLHVFSPWALAIAPDGRAVLVSSVADSFVYGDPTGFWAVQGFRIAQQRASIHAYALSPDNRTLLLGAGATPVLWDLANAREIHRFAGHEKSIQSLAFAPDGRSAISGGEDQTLRVWDMTGLQ